MAGSAFFTQRITVKSLVSAHAFGSAPSAIDSDTINCFDDQFLIMMICFTNLIGNRVSLGIADDGSLYPVNPVFS